SGEVDALVVGEHVYRLDSAAVADVKLRGDALAQMDDAVMAFDVEDRLVFMNRAAERQYGRSASETLGLHRCHLYEERWRDPAEALL
ncbi:PAS domain-containing protein, partial [Escherichia coli]|uniref:PAS domain-containing protein n=1 Tax=Escherichia coli TaxID=562 RepID=UPI0021186B32